MSHMILAYFEISLREHVENNCGSCEDNCFLNEKFRMNLKMNHITC